MAATWIKSLHVKKGKSKSSVVAAVIDYVENPSKTNGGRLITSFQCDSRVAEEAKEIGRQLALSFTKNKHAFVVATHIDREHALSCKRCFQHTS